MIELLVRHGADPHHRSKMKLSPLHHAVILGRAAVATELLSLGADTYDMDSDGRDSLMLTLHYNRPYTLQALLQATDTLKPFKVCAPHTVDQEHVNNRSRPSKPDLAAHASHQRFSDFSLQESRDSGRDSHGRNGLHHAGALTGIEVMRVLMGVDLEGLDPTAKAKYGDTPTDLFYFLRDQTCTIIRPPFEEEEEAWWQLMEAACRDNGIDFETFEPAWWEKYQANRRSLVEVDSDDEDDEHGQDVEVDEGPGDDGSDGDETNDAHNEEDRDDEFVDAVEAQQA